MKTKPLAGVFEVIDSFAIRNRKQFYFIGTISEGKIEKDWFVNIAFNPRLALTIRISEIEEVEMASEVNKYTLLVADCNEESIDLLLALKVGLERLQITIDGED